MRNLTVNIERLRPIQDSVSKACCGLYSGKIPSEGYSPIPVIQDGEYFLLGDGHHTSSALWLLGERQVDIKILENDSDVYQCMQGVYYVHINFQGVLDDMKGFSVGLEKWGIFEVKDLFLDQSLRVRDISLQSLLASHA